MRNKQWLVGAIVLATVAILFSKEEIVVANGWEEDLNASGTTTMILQTDASVQLTMGGKRIEGTLNAANASTNPDEAGKVLTEIATITVGNTDGYTVAVSGNASLTGERNSSHTIPSVSTAKTLGSMNNEWGYYGVLGDSEANWNPSTSFKAMTSSQQTVGTGGATTSNVTKTVTLFYGARVNDSIAEDFYGNTVTLSVVAQPRTVTTSFATFDGATTMQEMTAAKCEKANVHDTKLLTDTRDNKKYWVTKLLDGNCWMSQNLDLDITTTNITTETSDVTSNWTASSTYPARATTTSLTTGSTTNIETYSWDLGQYVINAPTGTTNCGNNATGLSGCTMFTAVGSRMASTDPDFYRKGTYTGTDGTTSCTKMMYTSISTATSGVCAQYDAHYLVGNYYSWNAATAGTGGTIKNEDAAGSICPKGWKLPGSATSDDGITKGTYAYLLRQYGLTVSYNLGAVSGTSEVNGKLYDIALSPLFLVRAGEVYSSNATTPFQRAGNTGYYWSSRAYSSTGSAYGLNFGINVYPSLSYSRYYGYSLRCLVPTT